MDEQGLFERFHQALDVEPRPGAYERLRSEITSKPDALRRQPAFRMRVPEMGVRMAALLAVVAVLIMAMAAAFVATHHSPVGSVPAQPDPATRAYSALVQADYGRMTSATSPSSCVTILDPTCAASVAAANTAFQHWIDDLNGFGKTPAQFATIDGQLRRHLSQVIVDLNAVVAFQRANDGEGFALASSAAAYERAWVDPATFTIEGSYPKVSASYHDAVSLARLSLDACVKFAPSPADLGCTKVFDTPSCLSFGALNCEIYIQGAATELQTLLIGLLQNVPSSGLVAKDAQLRADLALADTDLLKLTVAVLDGNPELTVSGQQAFNAAIVAADNDSALILSP